MAGAAAEQEQGCGKTTEAPNLVVLTAKAARLAPFACRTCGEQTRRMVEYPALFFRCEPCAAEDRWPDLRPRGRRI